MPAPVLVLPFHLDERLADDSIVLPGDLVATMVEPRLPDGDQWARLVALYDELAAHVATAVAPTDLTTVLTGDCLALLGTLAGAQRAGLDPSVVWFDAHGDVHTLASSTSGYLGGMALRMALGADADKLGRRLDLRPLPEEHAVLVDARDLDPGEIDYLATSRVRRQTVDRISVENLPAGPLIVHVDLDVIDAAALPGLRFPVLDGPSTSDVLAAVDRLVASGRVAILDIACTWHDPADQAERETHRDLLAALLDRDSDS